MFRVNGVILSNFKVIALPVKFILLLFLFVPIVSHADHHSVDWSNGKLREGSELRNKVIGLTSFKFSPSINLNASQEARSILTNFYNANYRFKSYWDTRGNWKCRQLVGGIYLYANFNCRIFVDANYLFLEKTTGSQKFQLEFVVSNSDYPAVLEDAGFGSPDQLYGVLYPSSYNKMYLVLKASNMDPYMTYIPTVVELTRQ